MTLDELNQALIPSHLPGLSGNIYCIGRNYADHAKELQNEIPKEPVMFLKAPSALRPFTTGAIACADETFHHEIELVLLVTKRAQMGLKADLSVLGGITLGLDLTRRTLQTELKKQGLPWTLSKSFAGSGLLHRFQSFKDHHAPIEFSLEVNGEKRQVGNSGDMIFGWQAIVDFLLQYQDLHPGDVIYTGTPAGVAGFKKGDRFRAASSTLLIDAEGVL